MTTSRAFDLFAFIAGNSNLEPLLEGLVSQIHMDLSLIFQIESNWGPADNYFILECHALT